MFKDLGIVKHGKALAYGSAGRFKWLPFRVQRLIVSTWNHITCVYYGHTGLMLTEDNKMIIFGSENYPICANCSKEIKEFKNDEVVRAPTYIECVRCGEEKECFYIPNPFTTTPCSDTRNCPPHMWVCVKCMERLSGS